MTYLYVFQNTETKMIKIGITDNVDRRKSQLQRQCGNELFLCGWVETHCAATCEAFILDLYSAYRQHGEWLRVEEKNDRVKIKDIFKILCEWRDDNVKLIRTELTDYGEEIHTSYKTVVSPFYITWIEEYSNKMEEWASPSFSAVESLVKIAYFRKKVISLREKGIKKSKRTECITDVDSILFDD